MKTYTFNENGEDYGIIISMHTQGGNWIACITNDSIDHWVEKQLHYSIQTKEDVIEWAKNYAEERKCTLKF